MIPQDPLGRIRLAFHALASLGAVLAGTQIALLAGSSPLQLPAAAALALAFAAWVRLYASGRPAWWIDLAVGLSLFVYGVALPLPDLGLILFVLAILIHTLYGRRRDSVRGGVLILGAYLAAETVGRFWESEILIVFVPLQIVVLLLMGVVIRVFHETLIERSELTAEVERLARMEAVTRLTGGIAHDFNNLLTAITGSLDLALLDLESDHPVREDLLLARRTAERAAGQTRQLLSFSRRAMVRPRPVDVRRELEDMEPLLRRLVRDKGELTLQLCPRPCGVVIDPTVLEQVVANLVVNAAEAVGEDGVPVEILVQADILDRVDAERRIRSRALGSAADGEPAVEAYVMIRVTDSGTGMDRATVDRMFDPFFTTRETGSGLGLATVYGAVTQAGGHIHVESTPGRGTVVEVLLPKGPSQGVGDAPAAPAAGEDTGS